MLARRKWRRDLTGQVFGRWLVLCEAPGYSRWHCQCVCGTEKDLQGSSLVHGTTHSCGCLLREINAARATHGEGHGENTTPEYWAWTSMRQRCLNEHSVHYPKYGGLGITISPRWDSYENFLEDMGRRPEGLHFLDRYPNEYGNYEPGNCRWATPSENRTNRRHFVESAHVL